MRVFLSYNKADKRLARTVGANLVLVDVDVWFDEWEIQAGDSIPGKLNEGLQDFDVFVILWSESAAQSNWVRQELHTAIVRAIEDSSAKIIPCKLDATPIPPLIADRQYVDFSDVQDGVDELVGNITGIKTRQARLMAIQEALDGMGVEWIQHPAVGPLICCPDCGKEDSLKPWNDYDEERDRAYWGLSCGNCGWSGGGDV